MTGRVSPLAGSMLMSKVGMRRLAAHVCASGVSASSIQVSGRCPANLMIGGSLSRGWNGTGGEADHREIGDPEQGRQEPVGVGTPCGSPHDLEPCGQFLQPSPVVLLSRTGSSPGKNSCWV